MTQARRNEKLGAYAMKRVAAGVHLPTPRLFEPVKHPDGLWRNMTQRWVNRSRLFSNVSSKICCERMKTRIGFLTAWFNLHILEWVHTTDDLVENHTERVTVAFLCAVVGIGVTQNLRSSPE